MTFGDLDARILGALYGDPAAPAAWTAWRACMVGMTVVGGGWASLGLVPLLAAPRTRRFGAALAGAIAVQAIAVWAIKAWVGRVRPWIALSLPPPIGAPHDPSFPSGHAAGSFCVAAFLAVALPRLPLAARASLFVVASLVALSRVYLGCHFPSDVCAGALLGALVGGAAGARYLRAASTSGRENAPALR